MKYIGYALLLVIAFAAYSFKPSDKTVTITPSQKFISKNFEVGSFNELEVSSGIKVIFTQSDGPTKVVANCPDNLIDRLDVKNDNGELKIRFKKGTNIIYNGQKAKSVTFEISAPALKEIELSSAAGFTAQSLNSKDLSIDLSGASSFKVESLVATKADIELGGASSVNLTNAKIANCEFDLSGASVVKVNNYIGEKGDIEVSGASRVEMAGKLTSLKLYVSGASTAKLSNLVVADGSVNASGASGVTVNMKNMDLISASGSSKVTNKAEK
ncbi:MAG: DUF2807 domain-containing protein [Muribaculaceae bacterium]|nr:DUF2807 domain-containing protein [Muribaculaceae bacterium]